MGNRKSVPHPVGADAHIGPLGSYEFAEDSRENGAFCRADVGIGPYSVLRKSAAAQRAEQSPAPTNLLHQNSHVRYGRGCFGYSSSNAPV